MRGEEWYAGPRLMTNFILPTARDLALLRLLELTPVTAAQIKIASVTFPGEAFRDERRVRERLQSLIETGFVRKFPVGIDGGGLLHYYRLSREGFRLLHADDHEEFHSKAVAEIAPSRFRHAMTTADVMVHILLAGHQSRIRVLQSHGDSQLTLAVGEYRQQPDCHFQLEHSGKIFNLLFEIDNATEPLNSHREQSIRTKLLGYEAYQDWVLQAWRENRWGTPRPVFRVVFLTAGIDRAKHILWLAAKCARNPDRHLCYAGIQESFLGEPKALTLPILNDHHGRWQALVELQPSSRFLREPIRLTPPLAPGQVI